MRTLRILEDMAEKWEIRDGLEWLEQRERLAKELGQVDASAERQVHVTIEGEEQGR